jgi:hypothetical protein
VDRDSPRPGRHPPLVQGVDVAPAGERRASDRAVGVVAPVNEVGQCRRRAYQGCAGWEQPRGTRAPAKPFAVFLRRPALLDGSAGGTSADELGALHDRTARDDSRGTPMASQVLPR